MSTLQQLSEQERIGRELAWIKAFAQKKGYSINPNTDFLHRLVMTMIENEELYGKRICPCREPVHIPEEDAKIICPCAFHEQEIAENGTCHCTMFGRADLTMEEWGRAIQGLMEEFSLNRTVADKVIDGRGLSCPGPVFLTKRELMEKKTLDGLVVIVDNHGSVINLTKFGEKYGYGVSADKRANDYYVYFRTRG